MVVMKWIEILRRDCSQGVKWRFVLVLMLAIGLFVQVSGKVWVESGSARNAQVYIWLLLPALVCLCVGAVARVRIGLNRQYIIWGAFLAWVALSTLWATNSESSSVSLAKRGLLVWLYLMAILFLLKYDEGFLRGALVAGIVVVALGALVSLIYQYGYVGRSFAYRAYRMKELGIGNFINYGHPVASGIFHGAIATWALTFALDRKNTSRQSLLWLSVFAVLAIYVFLTYTRGAWFALLGGFIAAVFFQNSKRGWWLLLISGVAVAIVFVIMWPQLVVEFETKQLSGRGSIWVYYFEVMSGHWIFGHGLGTEFLYMWPDGVQQSPHAHSLYLQQVYDSGIISLALLGAGLLGLAHKAWKLRSNYWVRLAFPALVFALIAMLTDVERVFTRPGDYWTLFWLPVAILLAVPMRSKQADQAAPSS